MKKNILIILEKDGLLLPNYFLTRFVDIWGNEGHEVVIQNKSEPWPDADLVFLHVDLTIIPEDCLINIHKYPVAINGLVNDISKRNISNNILNKHDNYNGEVIVKTNKNCGGFAEHYILMKKSICYKIIHSIRRRLPLSFRSIIPSKNYPVFESIKKVPLPVWYNSHLIVEKFIPEIREGYYCLRTWIFFGDQETNSLSMSEHKVIKSRNVIKRETIDHVPDELRQIRQEMKIDFGKIDYVISDDMVVLYDVSLTPTFGYYSSDKMLPSIEKLAKGIHHYFE